MKVKKNKEEIKQEMEVKEQEVVEKGSDILDESLENKIAGWKKLYSNIYKTEVDGEDIIWRPLNRQEYKNVIKNTKDLELSSEEKNFMREDEIVKIACLYPDTEKVEKLIESKAGFSFMLSDIILSKSGFDIKPTVEL